MVKFTKFLTYSTEYLFFLSVTIDQFRQTLFQTTTASFEEKALWLFRYQAKFNPIYKKFVSYLNINPEEVTSISTIPFLPIALFKNHELKTHDWKEESIFTSSGTTGINTSKHFIKDLDFYFENTDRIFTQAYSHPSEYVVLALLPSYLERSGSGLISMVNHFINLSNSPESGFYLYNHQELAGKLTSLRGQKVMLFGVTFALLDFVENHSIDFPDLLVFETGGMKGRKEELTRNEVHQVLKKGFDVAQIQSEYGMTELQSQAYSKANGLFETPSWMNVLIRETDDPLTLSRLEKTGGINVIDLANCDTCAFIATEDLGKLYANGSFEILGRIDHSDARGCSLLVV